MVIRNEFEWKERFLYLKVKTMFKKKISLLKLTLEGLWEPT